MELDEGTVFLGVRDNLVNIDSFRLTVTAPDMEKVQQTFSGQPISLSVKAGAQRSFTLEGLDAGGTDATSNGNDGTLNNF